ncbi:MAG TPA: glycine cleavage T C-terminal barrel domain-containing protein [Candidatus Paceibacterota bacterium]|nr:glycine cleavage T C-terminal barrel domain-containing protein [Candidatus Paceibacterota bacterium]
MTLLALHEFHHELNGRFSTLNGAEVVNDYGDWLAEHAALTQRAGVIDMSFRSRLCLLGADRVRFLHGQVTNDVNRLRPGEGCYAAVVTAKGKLQSDLNVHRLPDELLLDFEPGFSAAVTQRLEKFLVADDVEIVDVASQYGLLSAQGPAAAAVIRALEIFPALPHEPFRFSRVADATLGEIYLMNQPRLGSAGFDLFVPANSLGAVMDKLIAGAKSVGGRACGWRAFETARIEAGIPRFGIDMTEDHLPQECGIGERAVSYNKGCYIGQEVLNRIHTMGHVNRELRKLNLDEGALPAIGDRLFHEDREIGYITSVVRSPATNRNIALGYVRREAGQGETVLVARTAGGKVSATVQ